MANKTIIMLVDNREEKQEHPQKAKNIFKNSGFKATQVDPTEERQFGTKDRVEFSFLSQLQDRVLALQQRVSKLEFRTRNGKLLKRSRRRATQINREYNCPHHQCGKIYGSDTSLKNHLKLKHQKGN